MPGPTTEFLNQDLKDVKNDLKALDDNVNRLSTKIDVVCGQLNLLASLAKVALGVVSGLLTTGLVTGIWWASSITSDVRHMESQVIEIRKTVDQQSKLPVRPDTVLK